VTKIQYRVAVEGEYSRVTDLVMELQQPQLQGHTTRYRNRARVGSRLHGAEVTRLLGSKLMYSEWYVVSGSLVTEL
jgi:hypothetical protein